MDALTPRAGSLGAVTPGPFTSFQQSFASAIAQDPKLQRLFAGKQCAVCCMRKL